MTRRLGVLAACVLLAGCAYFNGIYNAHQAEKQADHLMRQGKEGQAEGAYASAAVKAETVLARYPHSRWAPEAVFIAGRGEALSGNCSTALPHLERFLASPAAVGVKKELAVAATGRCYVEGARYSDALTLLVPLTTAKDQRVRSAASLWAARAAIALGRTDDAMRYLGSIDASAAQWELIAASLGRQQYQRAESLLVQRVREGDGRDELASSLRTLWGVGERDAVESLVREFDDSRASPDAKGKLYLSLADLEIADGQDSLARRHLLRAQRLVVDTLVDHRAAARLTLLSLHDEPTLDRVQAIIASAVPRTKGALLMQRLQDNLLLLRIFTDRTDYTGASLFLAAEVARDSLRAPALAHSLFLKLVTTMPNTPLAPKALLAAADLVPDSAAVYRAQLQRIWPKSPFTVLVDGNDLPSTTGLDQVNNLLEQAWTAGSSAFADSMAARRSQVGVANGTQPPASTQLPPGNPPR